MHLDQINIPHLADGLAGPPATGDFILKGQISKYLIIFVLAARWAISTNQQTVR